METETPRMETETPEERTSFVRTPKLHRLDSELSIVALLALLVHL